ncbi:MAG TPA: ABC transporter permease subunit [Ktedonosporobacter sp.]|nr:ABC transporter permease subunit [Ktedonosporobacter sp.]
MTERFAFPSTVGEERHVTTIDAPPGQMRTSSIPPDRRPARRSVLRRMRRRRWVYLLLLPGSLYFLAFYYLPLLGNVSAFQDYSPYLSFFRSPWIGLDNFVAVFSDPNTWIVVRNTLEINLLQIVFAFPAGIILALLLNALPGQHFKRFMQSTLYLPHFLGWVIIISIWQQIFGGDGFISHLVAGLGGKPVDLISNPALFQPMVVLQVMWKESGWSTIMFLAAITSIDLSLYEAAAIDGAGKWQRMWHVTLPGIRSIIILLLILRLGNVLTIGFEQIFLLRPGFTTDVAEVVDTFVYSRGILSGQWGFAAAVALLKAAIGALLIFVSNRMAKKFGEEGLY